MSLADGELITQARIRRLQGSIPSSYTIFKDGTTYYAEACFPGGTDYSSPPLANLPTLVQSAVDDLTIGEIVFGEGEFEFPSTVNGKSEIHVSGQGPATKLRPTAAVPIFTLDGSHASPINRAKFSNLYFLGAGDGTLARAIWADCADDLETSNCIFRNIDGADTAAVLLRDCHRARIADNNFRGLDRALELLQNDDVNRASGSENCTIVGNTFETVTENSVRLDESDSPSITGNSFKSGGATGDPILEAVTSVLAGTITGNNFESSNGVAISGALGNSAITGNNIDAVGAGNNESAIKVDSGGNVISGNALISCYGHAIELNGSTNLVSGNMIYGPGWSDGSGLHDGIIVDGGKSDNQIHGNYIYSVAAKFIRYGITVSQASCNRTSVLNNKVISGGATLTKGVYDVGTDTITNTMPMSVSSLDLDGGATDIEIFHAASACYLIGYGVLYTEASGAGAANIRIGRYQDGVALDDDYFDIVASEQSKALGYTKYYLTTDLTQTDISLGDTVTVGTVGNSGQAGEVRIILKIAGV